MTRKALLTVTLFFAAIGVRAQVTITNVYTAAQTSTTETINWTTNVPASSQIRYGYDISLPFNNNTDSTLATSHSMTLTVLNNVRPYDFAVVSVDGSGHSSQSATEIFALCNVPTVPVAAIANNYYQYGSFTMTWVPPSGSGATPTVCGVPIQQTVTGTISSGGSLSAQVADSYMVIPGPGQWHVEVQDPGNIAPVSVNYPLASVSNDISPELMAAADASGLINCQTNTGTNAFYPSGCGGGGGSGPVVEVNGTPISPASPANFVDTASVTWTFIGGQIQANAAGAGCGPLSTDATSTNCGNGNFTSYTGTTGQAFGFANIDTVNAGNIVAVGASNLFNVTAASTTGANLIAIGSANIANITNTSTSTGNLIGIGVGTLDHADGRNIIAMGNASASNVVSTGPGFGEQSSDIIAIGDGVGDNNAAAISEMVLLGDGSGSDLPNAADDVVGLGNGSADGCDVASGVIIEDLIGIGDGSGNTCGQNNIGIGDGSGNNYLSGTTSVIGIGLGSADGPINTSTFHPLASVHDTIGIGDSADVFNVANEVIAIGDSSLTCVHGCGSGTPETGNSGADIIAIGDHALSANTTGTDNIAIGKYVGSNGWVTGDPAPTIGNSNQTGSQNTWIGDNSGPTSTTQLSNTIALGFNAFVTASNQTVIGNNSMTSLTIFGTGNGCLSSTSGVITGSGSACGSGGGGGSNVTINGGSTLTTVNLNSTTPAAPTNGINVTWATPSGINVSAAIVGDGVSTHFLNGTGTFTTPAGGSGTVTSIATTGPIGGGTITTTGTITCTTCVVATTPGAGIAHFAGSTQTVTSSAVNLASADVTGLLPHANIAATAVTPGSYTNANITVAADGSITAASNGSGGSGLPCSGTCTAGTMALFGASGTSVTNSHLDETTTAGVDTFSQPVNVNASSLPSQIALTYDSHTPTVGSSTTAVYAVDASGHAEISEGAGAFSRICTAANGVCVGGVSSFTGDGNLLSNVASAGAVTATLANAAAHKYWGNNTGSTAAPGYETIGAADLPATLFTDSKYYPAAVCNNAGAFSAALNVLDNNQPVGTCYNTATSTDASLNFNVVPVGGANQYAQGYANLPAYWTGTNITLYFTANINTGNFVWNIETACPAASGSTPGSPTWGSASTSTVSTPGTIGQQASVTISGIAANSVNGCPATGTTTPSEMTFRVFVTAGTATGSTSVAQLVGYTLSTSRSQ